MRTHDANRIVVVDHSAELTDVLSMLVQDLGYTVESACDSQEALALIDASLPRYVILDATMNRVDGQLLAQILRQRYRSAIVIIAVSGFDESFADVASTFATSDRYCAKPFEFADLERDLPSLS